MLRLQSTKVFQRHFAQHIHGAYPANFIRRKRMLQLAFLDFAMFEILGKPFHKPCRRTVVRHLQREVMAQFVVNDRQAALLSLLPAKQDCFFPLLAIHSVHALQGHLRRHAYADSVFHGIFAAFEYRKFHGQCIGQPERL